MCFGVPRFSTKHNPIEQTWDELRKKGFRNTIFPVLARVVDCLCDTIVRLTHSPLRVASITHYSWFINALMLCINIIYYTTALHNWGEL